MEPKMEPKKSGEYPVDYDLAEMVEKESAHFAKERERQGMKPQEVETEEDAEKLGALRIARWKHQNKQLTSK